MYKTVLNKIGKILQNKFKDVAGINEILDELKNNGDIQNEISTVISNSNSMTNGVPFSEYKKELDLRQECEKKLNQLKENISSSKKILVTKEEFDFLESHSNDFVETDLPKNVFNSLKRKKAIIPFVFSKRYKSTQSLNLFNSGYIAGAWIENDIDNIEFIIE